MYTLREYYGEQFINFCRQQYDLSRNYLKNCGKPKNNYDIFLIKQNKITCEIFRKYVINDLGY